MKCPGQDMQFWKPGDIFEADCPVCGNKVEFFKDEATRKCKGCGKKMLNPKMDFGCATYCKYASECLGELGPALIAQRNDLLKDRVAIEVKRILGQDFQRISRAVKVARHLEELLKEEKAQAAVLLCASHLHALEESVAASSSANGDHEVSRHILEDLGADPGLVTGVISLLDHISKGDTEGSPEVRLFLKAHKLVEMETKQ
jgi:hypothetical protein